MQFRPDIVISDRSGTSSAIIEVKALRGADTQHASHYLRNLLAHGILPQARFVLLITVDWGYLWFSPESVLRDEPPELVFPMDRIVQYYLPNGEESSPIRDLVLETIVQQWLVDLADGVMVDDRLTSNLRGIGFLDAVSDGLVSVRLPA